MPLVGKSKGFETYSVFDILNHCVKSTEDDNEDQHPKYRASPDFSGNLEFGKNDENLFYF